MNKTTLLSLAAAASLLAACGGSDDDPAPAPAPNPLAAVPPTATQSSTGLVDYLNALANAPGADQAEPVDLTGVTLPQPDDTEPAPV